MSTVCNPTCGATGTCSGTNTCTCFPGWTGSTCDSLLADEFPFVNNEFCLKDEFELGNGNFSNYKLHLFEELSTTPNFDGSLSMASNIRQSSLVLSKMSISELMRSKRNVAISFTMDITQGTNGDGYSFLFMSRSSLITPNPISLFFLLFFFAFF